jgi:two-component system nitrate/nitrite response regulator NarL
MEQSKIINLEAAIQMGIQKLTAMELKILSLIAQQKKSKEIAEILFVSEKTIRNHRYNIKKKLNLPKENNSLLKWAVSSFKYA